MIPVMVARDSVTAEQGILVSSSPSPLFPDFPRRLHSRLRYVHLAPAPPLRACVTEGGTGRRRPRGSRASVERKKKGGSRRHETGHEPFADRSRDRGSMAESRGQFSIQCRLPGDHGVSPGERGPRRKKRASADATVSTVTTSFRVRDTPRYTLPPFSPTTTTLTARLTSEES